MKTSSIFIYILSSIFAASINAQTVFYPLAVGTKWHWSPFSGTSSYDVVITQDTLASNGHRYSIIPAYWSIPERWERQEGNQVYRYAGNGQEWLLFDFSKSPVDTINSSPFVILDGAGTDTLFGAKRRMWSFNVGGVPGGIDAAGGASYVIADSIGLIEYSDWNSALRVVGAIIGSNIYGITTKVASNNKVSVEAIQLHQNYPNPFNGQATISFALPRDANVILRIFDNTGKVVEQLVDGKLTAGEHQYVWNATSFASGIYYCELIALNQRNIIRLVQIK
jgi:Secretion system C-terminal sorting domain